MRTLCATGTPKRPACPRSAAGGAGLLIGLLAVLFPAAPAQAHAAVTATSPVQRSVIGFSPTEVVIVFSEPIRPVPGKIQVLAPDGKRINSGPPAVDGARLRIPLRHADRPLGTYLVSYRVISADSHPAASGYTFSVGAPSAAPVDAGDASAVDPVVAVAVPAAKYLGYAGLVLAAGPVLLLMAGLWPRRLARRGPACLAYTGIGLVAASTMAGLWLQVPYSSGAGPLDATPGELAEILGTPFGIVLAARVGILAAVALLLRPGLAAGAGRGIRLAVTLLAVAGLTTWPLSGHPVASPVAAASVLADTVHVGAMAVWLGGLVVLAGFLLRRAHRLHLALILPAWSRLAVGGLAVAGGVQALIETGSLTALSSTGYGRLVLAKVALLAAVLAVAGYSRHLVRRRRAGDARGRLRRAVLAELAITAVVLASSAALVQTTPARTALIEAETASQDSFAQTLTSPLYTLQFDIYPVQLGENNTVHAYTYTADGKPQPALEWTVTTALPAAGIEPISAPLARIEPNHALGALTFPIPGQWQVRFTIRTSDIDEATVSTIVPVTPTAE